MESSDLCLTILETDCHFLELLVEEPDVLLVTSCHSLLLRLYLVEGLVQNFHLVRIYGSCVSQPLHQLFDLVLPVLNLLMEFSFDTLQLFNLQLKLVIFRMK